MSRQEIGNFGAFLTVAGFFTGAVVAIVGCYGVGGMLFGPEAQYDANLKIAGFGFGIGLPLAIIAGTIVAHYKPRGT